VLTVPDVIGPSATVRLGVPVESTASSATHPPVVDASADRVEDTALDTANMLKALWVIDPPTSEVLAVLVPRAKNTGVALVLPEYVTMTAWDVADVIVTATLPDCTAVIYFQYAYSFAPVAVVVTPIDVQPAGVVTAVTDAATNRIATSSTWLVGHTGEMVVAAAVF
jgi:hypothetical protein